MSTFSRFSWFATLLMLNACSSGSPQVAGGAGGEPDTQTSVPALVGCEAYSAD